MNDTEQPHGTRINARSIMYKLYALQNIIFSNVWCNILERIDKVNQLQACLKVVSEHFVSLNAHITVIRKEFDSYEAEAVETWTILSARQGDPKPGVSSSKCSFHARDNTLNKQGNGYYQILQMKQSYPRKKSSTFLVICDSRTPATKQGQEAESVRSCDAHRGKPDIQRQSRGRFRPIYAK